MGVSRFTTRVHLSTRVAGEGDGAALAGMQLWIIDYTVTERGRETSYTAPHVAEASARRMVANLLKDRVPGSAEADVYTEELGGETAGHAAEPPSLADVLRPALVPWEEMTQERWNQNIAASWELDDD